MTATLLPVEGLAAAAAALSFALVFLFGDHFHPFRAWVRDQRTVTSFGAGIAVAYVFVRVMPELHDARHVFTTGISRPLPYAGMGVYFLALIGFLVFYGLDHLRRQWRSTGQRNKGDGSFRLHVGAFAVYGGLVSYQLPEVVGESKLSIALYAVAMSFHFLGVSRHLREENELLYQRVGRWVLAAACAAGWVLSLLFSLPSYVLALTVAFVSGAVIVNSSIMELPSEQDGRFVPFLAGGLLYGLALIPLS